MTPVARRDTRSPGTPVSTMKTVLLDAGWRALLKDLGIPAPDVLRRAALPADLLSRPSVGLDTASWFRFWRALESLSGDRQFPQALLEAISADVFSPPMYAALCSADLAGALRRLAHYKRLIAPMTLELTAGRQRLTARPRWTDASEPPPPSLVIAELGFVLRLARIGLRERVHAVDLVLPALPDNPRWIERFFGVPARQGRTPAIAFENDVLHRPFVTANEGMWRVLEPELRRRLSTLDAESTLAARVKGVLLEALPGGRHQLEEVAARLAVGKRTLQRRLVEERTSFQALVQEARRDLAIHYLTATRMNHTEIAFLLGFEDPNSFFRAFSRWTGRTPGDWRSEAVPAAANA